jgi:hypothetical protein
MRFPPQVISVKMGAALKACQISDRLKLLFALQTFDAVE